VIGLVLLGGSLVVLPVLGYIKLRLARRLRSRALRGDGILSAAGAALAAAALAGLAMDQPLGWWWADPAAASLIGLFLLREGWRTLGDPSSALQSPARFTSSVRPQSTQLIDGAWLRPCAGSACLTASM
jgi:divalent metal cation (Fe/Co/Zn/Cd) transporter